MSLNFRQRLIYRALEPRIVFDGAASATVEATAQVGEAMDVDVAETQIAKSIASSDALVRSLAPEAAGQGDGADNGQEIAFVDAAIRDVDQLLGAIDPSIEIVFLDGGRDGVAQIAEALEGRGQISAVHILSHGEEGSLILGNSVLDAGSMGGVHADELARIGEALSDAADLLIYGCNFTGGAAGEAAATLLGELTGADIAASEDPTGHAQEAGDWDLETSLGTVETRTVAALGWQGVLANQQSTAQADNVTTDEDTAVSGSLISNDSDGDGDTLTVTAASIDTNGNGSAEALTLGVASDLVDSRGGAIGSITVNADGSYMFTPAADYDGAVPQLSYTISDGNGGSDSASLDITINPVVDLPQLETPHDQMTAEDTAIVYSTANGNAIRVVDPEPCAGGYISVTLSVTPGTGTLRLARTSGLIESDGNGTNRIEIAG